MSRVPGYDAKLPETQMFNVYCCDHIVAPKREVPVKKFGGGAILFVSLAGADTGQKFGRQQLRSLTAFEGDGLLFASRHSIPLY